MDRSTTKRLRHSLGCYIRNLLRSKVILSVLVVFITISLVGHYYISNIGIDIDSRNEIHRSRSKLDYPDSDGETGKVSELKLQIDELRGIKASVNNELRDLESRRQKLQAEISGYTYHIDSLRSQYESLSKEISQIRVALDQLKLEREETINQYVPNIKAPQQILMDPRPAKNIQPPSSPQLCKMQTCFDYSVCSLVSGFPVYVYSTADSAIGSRGVEDFIKTSVISSLSRSPYRTTEPKRACVFVVLVGEVQGGAVSAKDVETMLQELPYWQEDGRNHLLVNMHYAHNSDIFGGVNTGRAILVQSPFVDSIFRKNFDIVIPPSLGMAHGEVWQELSPISPVRRKYLLSFWGEISSRKRDIQNQMGTFQKKLFQKENVIGKNIQNILNAQVAKNDAVPANDDDGEEDEEDNDDRDNSFKLRRLKSASEIVSLISLEVSVVAALKLLQEQVPDSLSFQFSCARAKQEGNNAEWALCATSEERRSMLVQSTFSLILLPSNYSVVTTTIIQLRIYESLKNGAIPVVLGDYIEMPFSEILDWKRAAIFLPVARVTEIFFFLRTFTDSDIAEMRKQGRFIWETYFGSTEKIVVSFLAVMRTRLQIPASPVNAEPTLSVFNATFIPLKIEGADPEPETDEVLGPIEARFPSEKFYRNFTQFVQWERFNQPGDPFHLYPSRPWDVVLPSEAKYFGSGYGFRSIGKGVGGAGKEFSESLGGNIPREQFTIVILTYERELVLIKALQRLKGLPFLNKVIVVWNNPIPPASDLRWPNIGVPLHVVKTAKNSLNNRFLPYDAIETDSILSIDDDAHLRHDEIVFGFRVWREERDRIVGFPGRFHAWDGIHHSWHYNSNYSCELSMVLTGAAFYHKYYAYLYSYSMSQAIRDKVDEYTNCEDIAMNFLVSHITRKPPVKVTSRWTFRCPGCPQTLSNDETHFQERHKCINFFVKVYGYMPLLYTQYRVDSVLFKTRLPHDKQKCFKYI
ncbi:exostosin-like 3 [Gigantopelta aegis]|uniref:exostosin-like 3 n=1 Tax=Gigantopelta aegis TaxID=1735272 RepID=UPI001B88E013|nr:exostosin-like 3 [Gigantopelta aegis]